ncbi:MAG: hydroxymethylbilane synthase [Polyangiaceae bacterium]|nr:hydroxymethylbilane synthase [Polyangiaceae bacterium]
MTRKARTIVVATRKSALALAQCRQFLERWQERCPELKFEELHVVTTGDRIVDRPLAEIGGKGLFLKEIEEALIDGRADIAVHSMKDVPPQLHPDLKLACVPERERPEDVLVSRHQGGLAGLPHGATLGTSSLRRAVQLLERRPDLSIQPIRGNVGTRLKKCADGIVDATVLAAAGLNRLGLGEGLPVAGIMASTLTVEESLPAVGQGALAVEIRKDDRELELLLKKIEDLPTTLCTDAERGLMTAVEGDCKTPVAAYAYREAQEMVLRGFLADPEGKTRVRLERVFPWSEERALNHQKGLELGHALRSELEKALLVPMT